MFRILPCCGETSSQGAVQGNPVFQKDAPRRQQVASQLLFIAQGGEDVEIICQAVKILGSKLIESPAGQFDLDFKCIDSFLLFFFSDQRILHFLKGV